MPTVVLARTVVQSGAADVELSKNGSIGNGMLPLPGSRHSAVRAGLEFLEEFRDLLSDNGLLQTMQQYFRLCECQAEFLRLQRTTLQAHNLLDLLLFAVRAGPGKSDREISDSLAQ